ncbi:ankyrin repeat-containing protein ITN1-like isoform X2 [Daucus carota subsp. sativus]|uniref:ankyrin repeat-containing protein ITN1-like isoform X2 n=1 Tax=Daucus carota subsp. sativus TaxID=79200 RepID=UPI0007F03E93|nr:PREDICTED: ankyrin repeat-containing protein At3g12360-like isoform X2 [Daucus carota subsp. sativus]
MAGTGTGGSAFLRHEHSIDIITPPHPPLPITPSPPHHPRSAPKFPSDIYLSEDERKNYLAICLPLYEAALKGDWQTAQKIISKCPKVINVSITKNYETVLHIVSSTKHAHFVEELLKLMKPEDLDLQNKNRNTALCLAAAAGTVKIVEMMVEVEPNLLMIRGNNNMSPLLMAALFGHKEMVSYLYSRTDNMTGGDWTDTDRIMLLNACISAKLYDVALKLLDKHKKKLALATDKNALHILARNPSEFAGIRQPVYWRLLNKIIPGPRIGPGEKKCQALEIVKVIWGEIVQQKDDDIWDIIRGPQEIVRVEEKDQPNARYVEKKVHQSRLLFVAASLGNTEFLIELLRLCPELIWKIDDYERTIFHVAVLHRQESVYNLLYEIGSIKDLVTTFRDTGGNNILHLAAMMPEQNRLHIVSGVALQMQRELLWFKEVEAMVHPSLRGMKNNKGKTPEALFSAQHADLMEKGETWMKDTASQCMVVAALIATIMFAAAFTLPGGSNQDSGHPIFKKRSAFMVFVITDAISLFSSSASILMFLAILTARYAEGDFLRSLPIKLMIGLLALFISITTMMIAFSASFFLVYTKVIIADVDKLRS